MALTGHFHLVHKALRTDAEAASQLITHKPQTRLA